MQVLNLRGIGTLRIVGGFLCAPAVPAILMFTTAKVFDPTSSLFGADLLLMLAYLVTIFMGLPTYWFMQKNHMYGLRAYVIVGLVVGIASYLIVLFCLLRVVAFPGLVFKNTIGMSILGMAYGMSACVIFWLIAVKGNQHTTEDQT